jgi:hypothetical protein
MSNTYDDELKVAGADPNVALRRHRESMATRDNEHSNGLVPKHAPRESIRIVLIPRVPNTVVLAGFATDVVDRRPQRHPPCQRFHQTIDVLAVELGTPARERHD